MKKTKRGPFIKHRVHVNSLQNIPMSCHAAVPQTALAKF